MKYRYCFFDLDGTVSDSAPGIAHSVQYALQNAGIQPPPAEELTGFFGPPLMWSFSTFFGMDREASLRAVDDYRVCYRAGAMFECTIYEGIRTLLEQLNHAGIVCVLATCKPYEFANQILAHFDLDRYFSLVSGPEMDGTRNEKDEVIAYAMEQLHITDPTSVLMVGDRGSDIRGALANGVEGAGVLWGFGEEAELREAGASYLFSTPKEIADLLLFR